MADRAFFAFPFLDLDSSKIRCEAPRPSCRVGTGMPELPGRAPSSSLPHGHEKGNVGSKTAWRYFMKLRVLWLLALFLIIFVADCAGAHIYSIPLQYQPTKTFPSLQQKFGSRLGIAPFEDERREKTYIGIHFPLQGLATQFESHPMPLERALQQCAGDAFSWLGVKVVSVSNWDGTPESLKEIDADSVLTVKIKKFWTEGTGSLLRANIKAMVQLEFHLGVKSEGKVFTRSVEMEKEITVLRSTPERVKAIIDEILTEVFDTYFSSPY